MRSLSLSGRKGPRCAGTWHDLGDKGLGWARGTVTKSWEDCGHWCALTGTWSLWALQTHVSLQSGLASDWGWRGPCSAGTSCSNRDARSSSIRWGGGGGGQPTNRLVDPPYHSWYDSSPWGLWGALEKGPERGPSTICVKGAHLQWKLWGYPVG